MTLSRLRAVCLLAFALFAARTVAQCPAGTDSSGQELVTNGNFEMGDTAFTSQYTYCNTPNCLQTEGYYAVGVDATYFHPNFVGHDHTTGSGNFLIVNGAPSSGISVWCQTVSVQPNTEYLFSTWVSSMVTTNPASLQFSINGVPLGNPFNAPSFFTNLWLQFSHSWNSGTDTSATICIINLNTQTNGNDFGLDDISFQPCVCVFQTSSIANAAVCPGASTTLVAGSGAQSYQWLPAVGLSCTTCQSPSASPTITSTYTLIATLGTCHDTVSTTVTLLNPPTANAGNDTIVCPGMAAYLHGSGGASYHWTPSGTLNNGNVASPTATTLQSTQYTLTVTSANGCTDDDTVTVSLYPQPNAVAGPDTVVCTGVTVNLHASGGLAYAWNPSSGLSVSSGSNVSATVISSTTYTVNASDANGCVAVAAVVLQTFPNAPVFINSDTVICYGETITLHASGGSQYSWNGPQLSCTLCNDQLFTATENGLYVLSAVDSNGCNVTDSTRVLVNDACAEFIFPDAFTPNADGLNDVFRPLSKSVSDIGFSVYDRWGKLVFASSAAHPGWDGTFNGKPQPNGVYAWTAQAKTNLGEIRKLQGNVTLLR